MYHLQQRRAKGVVALGAEIKGRQIHAIDVIFGLSQWRVGDGVGAPNFNFAPGAISSSHAPDLHSATQVDIIIMNIRQITRSWSDVEGTARDIIQI